MGRLDFHKEYKTAAAAAPTAAGNFLPVTLWETGIPVDSLKQMDRSQFVRVGNVVTVWGSMVTKFDNSTPTFDMTVPVTNGNPLASISGYCRKQRSTQQLSIIAAIFGGGSRANTHVGLTGSGIANTANEVWDFRYTYTLT